MDLTPFREQLAAEIARCRSRADALQTVLDAAEAVPGEESVPMVRPPAEGVPQPPVELPRPPAKEQRKPAAKRGEKYDWSEVAAEITRALDAGQAITKTLAVRYGVSSAMASWMIKRCREKGLIPESGITRKPSEAALPTAAPDPAATDDVQTAAKPSIATGHTKVLACNEDDCDFECAVDRPMDLRTHVVGIHGRRPSDDERTPVIRGAIAAA